MLGVNKKMLVAIVVSPLVWGFIELVSPMGPTMNIIFTLIAIAAMVVLLDCFSTTRRLVNEPHAFTANESHVLPLGPEILTADDLPTTSEMVFAFAPDGYKIPRSSRKMRCVGVLEHATVVDYMGLISLKAKYYLAEDANRIDRLMDRVSVIIASRMEKYPIEKWKYPNFPAHLARLPRREFPFIVRIEHNRIYIQEI